jgi:hypothetical protein
MPHRFLSGCNTIVTFVNLLIKLYNETAIMQPLFIYYNKNPIKSKLLVKTKHKRAKTGSAQAVRLDRCK